MVVSLMKTTTNNNEQRTMNCSKQTQSNPKCSELTRSELACDELVERVEGVEPISKGQVFIESNSIKAIGAKIKTGSQAHNSGITLSKTASTANILQTKVMTKHAAVVPKLIIMADFIDFGSRQTKIGRHTISITRLMRGSVIRKCFWL